MEGHLAGSLLLLGIYDDYAKTPAPQYVQLNIGLA